MLPAQGLATRPRVVQGRGQLSGTSEAASKREGGWATPLSWLEGWTHCLGWAGKGRKGGRGGRTRQVLRDRDPEIRAERDLQRQTKGVQRQRKAETPSEKGRFRKVEEDKS